MSFLAKLSLDGSAETNVLYCSYRFTQGIDATGKPSSIPQGGTVTLTVESTSDADIFDWMINPTATKGGIITFYRRDMKSKLKTLEFTSAYCVSFQEEFNHAGEMPMQISFTLSAKKLKINDSEFKNNQPD
jgi:hypothetical protein